MILVPAQFVEAPVTWAARWIDADVLDPELGPNPVIGIRRLIPLPHRAMDDRGFGYKPRIA